MPECFRLVIKNLFLGYFTTPQHQRHDVLHTIGGVLKFTADDFDKVGALSASQFLSKGTLLFIIYLLQEAMIIDQDYLFFFYYIFVR